MATDSHRKRAAIIVAAEREFADRGLARARTAAICREAGVNNQAVHAYFGSKESLFDSVVEHHVREVSRCAPIDPDDLARSAGDLFEHLVTRPDWVRLERWRALERPTATGGQLWALEVDGRAVSVALSIPLSSAHELLALLVRLVHAWIPDVRGEGPPAPEGTATLRRRCEAAVSGLLESVAGTRI